MRKLIILTLLLSSTLSFGKSRNFQITKNEKVIGQNLIDSTEIRGIEYTFPERIHKTYLDTISGLLTVKTRGLTKNRKWLRNSGYILQYDLNNESLLWSKKIAYQTSDLLQFGNTMILSSLNKSNCLDIRTGEKTWKVKNNIYYADPIEKIGIGYRLQSLDGYSNKLEGINLENGEIIWKRKLDQDYGWNDVFYTNDSTLIVVASGLHAININNGKGWDYDTETGKKDYTGTIAGNALGVVAGLLTGTFMMSLGNDLVSNVVSNTLIDSSSIYLASREQLARVDKQTGEVIWKHTFPKKIASKSKILMREDLVFMVNMGYASMGNRQLYFGKPFIAAFDRETGKQQFQTLIDVKKDPIFDFKLTQDVIYLVFKNRIEKYSMETGSLITKKDFPQKDYGDLECFIGKQVFFTNEKQELESLPKSDVSKLFVFTSQKEILKIDDQLNITDTITSEDISICYIGTENYKFITKDEQTLIINNNGDKIAEIESTKSAVLKGKTLYYKKDNKLIAIDLSDILIKE